MTQDPGWFVHSINKVTQVTTGTSTPNVTVSTASTDATDDLDTGIKFLAGGKTYTYVGSATVGNVTGFVAKLGTAQYFFSHTDVGNTNVEFVGDDTVICFYPGTRIRTQSGEAAVETLSIGDMVLTAEGEARPVRWVGRQTVSTLFADPLRVLPIRIAAGALAEGLPARDLLVSPDHAILAGGVLVQAAALVNGTTIRREEAVPTTFTYYHVELADHSLILAEGVPAETFVDNVERLGFDNWNEHEALYGAEAPIPEMTLPRAKANRQVPMAVRQQIAARAAALMPGLTEAA